MGSGNQSLATERDRPSLRPPEDRPGQLERGARPASRPGRRTRAASSIRRLGPRGATRRARRPSPAETRVPPSSSRSQASGVVASSAPTTNSSRWSRRMTSARSPKPAGRGRRSWSLSAELGAGQPERGDGLVDRAVGLGPGVVLGDARAAEQQAGRAVVAAAGRDGESIVSAGAAGGAVGVSDRVGGPLTTSGRRRADPSARPAGSP